MGTKFLTIIGVFLVCSVACATVSKNEGATLTDPVPPPIVQSKNNTDNISPATNSSLNSNRDNTNHSETLTTVGSSSEDQKVKPKDNESELSKGRSLNFDIEKYVSPEFHNRNNVYTLPTSSEIDKFLEPNSQESSSNPERSAGTTDLEQQIGLTTPRTDLFDQKHQQIADGIKQNLDDLESKRLNNEKPYDTNLHIHNVADVVDTAKNDTNVSLHTTDYKRIEIKSDDKKGSKVEETSKSIDYQSTYLEEKPENVDVNNIPYNKNEKKAEKQSTNESVTTQQSKSTDLITTIQSTLATFVPTKKPQLHLEFSLRNNSIETSAPDVIMKPKTGKHFPDFSTFATAKPFENAINISKRGSTKYTEATTTTTTPIYANKKSTLPTTATTRTSASSKETPISTTVTFTEKNVPDETKYVQVLLTTPARQDKSTIEDIITTENTATTTETYTTNDSKTIDNATELEITTITDKTETETKYTEITFTNTSETQTSSDSVTNFTNNEETTILYQTTTNLPTTILETTTLETITETESSDLTSTTRIEQTSNFSIQTEFDHNDVTVSTIANNTKIPTKTESENELYTTARMPESKTTEDVTRRMEPILPSKNVSQITESSNKSTINPTVELTETDFAETTLAEGEEYPDVVEKKYQKNATDDLSQGNTSYTRTTLPERMFTSKYTTPKSILVKNTTYSTSSTEHLSNDGDSDNNAGMIAAITISAVGGVCLILLAGLLLIMRKRQKRMTYGQRCRPVSLDAYSLDNVSVYNSVRRKGALRASKRSYGNPAFDDPVSITHQMNFQTLAKFVDNSEGINAEFEEIPQVTVRTSEVPAGCETKNRYANVIPLPETRVFLKAFDNCPNSDYINANYVMGPKNTHGYYIACQAPLQNTIDDFWRMVWEQQCRVILMLTDLFENGIEKCADYLPPSEVVDCHRLFGDFQITLKKREVKEKYIISSLQLKNMVSNSWREITHLWYLGWPERGVPPEANSLIAFLIEARSHLKAAANNNSTNQKIGETTNLHMSGLSGSESGPMVVHCSPGTGRTGTVIACDIAIRDFELTRTVDIPKIVYRVRRDRASAVQTKEQYAFIYKVISLYATKLTGGALDSI